MEFIFGLVTSPLYSAIFPRGITFYACLRWFYVKRSTNNKMIQINDISSSLPLLSLHEKLQLQILESKITALRSTVILASSILRNNASEYDQNVAIAAIAINLETYALGEIICIDSMEGSNANHPDVQQAIDDGDTVSGYAARLLDEFHPTVNIRNLAEIPLGE